jgi:hypothetical protein
MCYQDISRKWKKEKLMLKLLITSLNPQKRKRVPCDTKKSMSITRRKLDLEEVLATNKAEEELLRHAQIFLPQVHKLEEAIAINFSQENNAREKEDLPVIIHVG